MTINKCSGCGRALSSVESVRRGEGKGCRKKRKIREQTGLGIYYDK